MSAASAIASALAALMPVIEATVRAIERGGDWREAARAALDEGDAADPGPVGPRADAIEARHLARIASPQAPAPTIASEYATALRTLRASAALRPVEREAIAAALAALRGA